ncbi:nicotinamidase/pyrazinamidase [Bythopirellula goksoeyrii]|uniref:Nicotinamidase/pyrazinamidase n=2 Tax=Bythopirellula goksoeyrii TaxID=1400387 RepID=A0A5B9Q8V2_9BACT|nr:nicotinamidase/pyrazinamidase [Bythopirellula goksoeyrii]
MGSDLLLIDFTARLAQVGHLVTIVPSTYHKVSQKHFSTNLPYLTSNLLAMSRSPELMNPNDTGLLVVDVQDRLVAVQPDEQRIVWNIRRLLDGAKILGVRAAATEQYPEKLGPTSAILAERLDTPVVSKLAFSCADCEAIFDTWRAAGIHRVLVVGIETHVCVQQTVLDLLAAGMQVIVAADAVGARHAIDHDIALRRMETSGALLTTTEAALFEWCGVAGTPEFKQISALVKEVMSEGNSNA